ncbi:MAG: type I-E CRISPR-associated protein Cse2/CasB [Candidatus Sumerlaeia bacterium]|nr:type I-E CRISPR-associated protein Cse2/CasB [Candidatus Sumerlaeia bacterium]
MNLSAEFIQRLEDLQDGERSRLRRLLGQPLNASLQGFDLFTGLWWPLRERSPRAPERRSAWLVAKLFGASGVPHVAGSALPCVLGRCEPREEHDQKRFRDRFDALLCSPLAALEPHLAWGLREAAKAIAGRVPWARDVQGIDWEKLLDDLRLWDRGSDDRDIRDIWAEVYLNAAGQPT